MKNNQSVDKMKMRTIKLTPKILIESLQGKSSAIASNLPNDVQVLDIKFDLYSNQVSIIVRSDSFEEMTELYPIPEYKLNFTHTTAKTAAPQVSTTKIEAKLSPPAKAEPAAAKSPEPSNVATKMAGEFTPEQRKLLNFKTEGDFIIVKPTQFLKEEWEDINEVVRSLGGKWVKGDIISYWQIPTQ